MTNQTMTTTHHFSGNINALRAINSRFSVSENGELLFDTKPLSDKQFKSAISAYMVLKENFSLAYSREKWLDKNVYREYTRSVWSWISAVRKTDNIPAKELFKIFELFHKFKKNYISGNKRGETVLLSMIDSSALEEDTKIRFIDTLEHFKEVNKGRYEYSKTKSKIAKEKQQDNQ